MDGPLYHYCSLDTFSAVLSSGQVWLSSLSHSNDYREGQLVSEVIGHLAEKAGIDSSKRTAILQRTDFFQSHMDALGFCMSEDGDLLSQWRAYAGDGDGVSLGFERKFLEAVCEGTSIKLHRVLYHPNEHAEALTPMLDLCKMAVENGAGAPYPHVTLLTPEDDEELRLQRQNWQKSENLLTFATTLTMSMAYTIKSPAFREELEWRLVLPYIDSSPPEFRVRSSGNRLIPYQALSISHEPGSVKEIVLGPKNQTPLWVVEKAIEGTALFGASVRKSEASYR